MAGCYRSDWPRRPARAEGPQTQSGLSARCIWRRQSTRKRTT